VGILLNSFSPGYPNQFRSPQHTLVQYALLGSLLTSGNPGEGDNLNVQAVGYTTRTEPAGEFGESGTLC